MAFRFGVPNDARIHREEELAAARLAYQQQQQQHQDRSSRQHRAPDGTPPDRKQDASVEPASPSPSPQAKKRNVVFPDPVAFRLARRFVFSGPHEAVVG
jgi:type II secretory pathway pseudopilin PulG